MQLMKGGTVVTNIATASKLSTAELVITSDMAPGSYVVTVPEQTSYPLPNRPATPLPHRQATAAHRAASSPVSQPAAGASVCVAQVCVRLGIMWGRPVAPGPFKGRGCPSILL